MGKTPPEEWKGEIPDVEYNLGPMIKTGYKIRLTTHNYLERVQSYNVFGAIRGELEPGITNNFLYCEQCQTSLINLKI